MLARLLWSWHGNVHTFGRSYSSVQLLTNAPPVESITALAFFPGWTFCMQVSGAPLVRCPSCYGAGSYPPRRVRQLTCLSNLMEMSKNRRTLYSSVGSGLRCLGAFLPPTQAIYSLCQVRQVWQWGCGWVRIEKTQVETGISSTKKNKKKYLAGVFWGQIAALVCAWFLYRPPLFWVFSFFFVFRGCHGMPGVYISSMSFCLAFHNLDADAPRQRARCARTGRFVAWSKVPELRVPGAPRVVVIPPPVVSDDVAEVVSVPAPLTLSGVVARAASVVSTMPPQLAGAVAGAVAAVASTITMVGRSLWGRVRGSTV